MGLNFAFVFLLERTELPRLAQAITARLTAESARPRLTDPPERALESTGYRFARDPHAPCLSFRDPVGHHSPFGCVYLERLEGLRFAIISLRAAATSMSHRFDTDGAISGMMREIAESGGVLAVAFDRELSAWGRPPDESMGGGLPFPEIAEYLPFWASEFGVPLGPARQRALEARATILGSRLASDTEEAVREALLDDDAFDARIDEFVVRVLDARSGRKHS
ncbi:MAG: hypothetical protein Q8L48_41480 [Archangium sp.]|nr:hypothetical protein [Archangium sp.]